MDIVRELIKQALRESEQPGNARRNRYVLWWDKEKRVASFYLWARWIDALMDAHHANKPLPLVDCTQEDFAEILKQVNWQADSPRERDPWLKGKITNAIKHKGRF